MKFNSILKRTIQYSFTEKDLDELEQDIVDYVKEYEIIYYQFSAQRLSACPHTTFETMGHHVTIGPSSWSIGVYQAAQLFEVVNRYNVTQLMPLRRDMNVPSRHEKRFSKSAYLISFLCNPVKHNHTPDMTIQKKIAKHLTTSFGGLIRAWLDILPQIMEHWVKVCIGNGGHLIRGAIAQMSSWQSFRDASFVRYELIADANAHCPQAKEDFVRTVYYGRLEYILHCTIPSNVISKNTEPKTILFGIITTCTQGHDATLELTYFRSLMLYIEIVDLAAICAVVGRIQIGTTNPQWVIVDRSGSWVRTAFTDDSLTVDTPQQDKL
ncbi:uncharacterized protein EI90DRAFT_3158848 [Cantharellus anzutake]|uniref:uncharacterized protein n=1 Tax=Cantharellus anzutake TaxID=1750568 RepID=UPI001907ECA8|nr:uncharacterized protein EI90DRAFT_3158848 [Cantharellus anzutake]KAF8316693.1 hypothetical protein EI90DRAFT_3158848 [Cantharellus anzutake]